MIRTATAGGRRQRAGATAVAVLSALLALTGCSANATSASGSPEASTSSSGSVLRGELTVYAAASLTASFNDLAARFHRMHPGVTVKPIDYDGSQILATQIVQGAPADVFASADQQTMDTVRKAGLTASDPAIFATNRLEIAVPPGNPKRIRSLAQLAEPGIQTVTCASTVPCGAAANALLEADGVKLTPVSEEQNVSAVVTKVASGAADAGLVYVTDVKAAGGSIEGVGIADAGKAVNSYPIAALKHAPNKAIATAFVAYVLSPAGRSVLRSYGFGSP